MPDLYRRPYYQMHKARLLGIAFAYFVLASATIATMRYGSGVTLVWIANALLLAELSIRSRKDWSTLMLACGFASFCATSFFGFGFAAAAPLVIANIGEATIGALIMRRLARESTTLESVEGIAIFVIAVTLAAAGTAFIGAGVAAVTGQEFWTNWRNWFSGHVAGVLAFAPIALLCLRGDVARWAHDINAKRVAEVAIIMTLVLATCLLVFLQDRLPLLFLPMLPLVIAVFRTGRFGTAVSIVILTLVGGWATIAGHGPFYIVSATDGQRIQYFQFYLAATVLTVLPVAAELNHRKALFRKLRASEARYRLVTEHSTDIVMNIDEKGLIGFASPSVEVIGGYDPEAIVGSDALDFVHPDDIGKVALAYRRAMAEPDKTHIFEYRGITAHNGLIWLESHAQGIHDENGTPTGAISTIRDISHRKSLEDRLAREANTDVLTGLVNRRGFMVALDAMIENHANHGNNACLAIFDIDFFKTVNDLHGHAAGDFVLRKFADAARLMVRGRDVVGRIGGEEFGIILNGVSPEQAGNICERLRVFVEGMIIQPSPGVRVRITVSAGIAAIHPGAHRDELFRRADDALYRAKESGRNRLESAA